MRTENQIFADYAGLPVLYGLAYVLLKTKVQDEQLFSPHNLQEILEQHLAVKVPIEAINAAMEAGIERNIFQRISGEGRADRYEVSRRRLTALFDHARVRKQSLIYRILKIGEGQFKEEMDHIQTKVGEDIDYRNKTDFDSGANASIYNLRLLAELTGPPNTRKIPIVYADSTRELDWPKWGALAAVIAVPIAILAIIVAIWLDNN